MQRAQQRVGGLRSTQDICDLPVSVEDEGGRQAVQPVVLAGRPVRIDEVRVRQVVLPQERATGGSSVRPVDSDEIRVSVELVSHLPEDRGLLLARRAPTGPEVDRGRLAPEGGECHLRRNEYAGRQQRRTSSGPEAVRRTAQDHDRDHRDDDPGGDQGDPEAAGDGPYSEARIGTSCTTWLGLKFDGYKVVILPLALIP